MDSNRIDELLEVYFEGITTSEQERELRMYFTSAEVAPHLEGYVGMFSAFAKAQQETISVPTKLPSTKLNYKWVSGIAAVVLFLIGMVIQNNMKEGYTGTYKDKEVAVLKTKQTLGMMTKMIQQSTAQLGAIREFENTTNRFLKQ